MSQNALLIEPIDLLDLLKKNGPHLKIIDASFALPGSGLDPQAEYNKSRIGKAVFFDIDDVIAPDTEGHGLPHMLPTPEIFAKKVGEMGISANDEVVVYDQTGMTMAACRVWWMFKLFDHENIRILNGGLPAWKDAGLPLNTEAPQAPAPVSYEISTYHTHRITTMDEVRNVLNDDDSTTIILDARPAERFTGKAAEPRAGLRSGHIPGSHNIPHGTIMDPDRSMRLLSKTQLSERFTPCGLSENKSCPVIISCGSGTTACALAFAAHSLGHDLDAIKIYDGSWSEWGLEQHNNLVETGDFTP